MNKVWTWAIAAGLALGPAPVCFAQTEAGARASASLWAGSPDTAVTSRASAPETAEESLEKRIGELEQSLADLENTVGRPRGLNARQPFDRRLDDLEIRLDKFEKRMNDLENRLKRAETRGP